MSLSHISSEELAISAWRVHISVVIWVLFCLAPDGLATNGRPGRGAGAAWQVQYEEGAGALWWIGKRFRLL